MAPDDEELIVPAPTNPMAVARTFLDQRYTADEHRLIRHHRSTFWTYDGTSWPEFDERRLASDLYQWLEPAKYWKKNGSGDMTLEDFAPTKHKLSDVVDAIRGHVHLDMHITPPAWIDYGDGPDVVPMANGLLDIRTRTLLPHTPDFFSPHVLPFEYDPDSEYPTRWLSFLGELWGSDASSIEALAEAMGYILGGSTRQQKIFMLVGPRRSGKGTIGRVLTGLLGAHNVAAPTLASLTTNFGLQVLIGRPLGLISDARLGSRADGSIAVERLLSISGEDSITVDRKYRDPWTGRLPTRFMILTNEVPRFTDASGALASRFIVLVLTRSFLGQEDPTLTDTLLQDAPGIFNWALDGLDRLLARGYFEQPAVSRDAMQRLEDLASPVSAFVRDRCVIGPTHEVEKDVLWAAWKDWCVGEGKDRAGTKAVFYRDLHAAYPGLRATRPEVDGKRVHVYIGIDLRSPGDPDGPDDDLDLHSAGPLTNPDRESTLRDAVPDGESQNPRSEASVRDRQGSSALYLPLGLTPDQTPGPHQPRPAETIEEANQRWAAVDAALANPPDTFVPGDVIRQFGNRMVQFTVKAIDGDNVDCWDRDHKLHTFHLDDMVIVRKGEQ
jgi:putative DNA primase/helicase